MSKKLFKDFPKIQQEYQELKTYYKLLKKWRNIRFVRKPTGNKLKDLYPHLVQYINLIHLKIIHQLSLILLGIEAENPEIIPIVRGYIETIGGICYIMEKITKIKSEPDKVWEILNKAVMGENKKTLSKKVIFPTAPQTFHSADYIRALDDVVTLFNPKFRFFMLQQYDFYCEYTHPNYLALESYWEVISGKLKYREKISCIREDQIIDILKTMVPLVLVYEYVLRKAQDFEKEFKKLS
jgi:hypothetical protein